MAIVNEALAHQYWPNEDPVGKQVRLEFPATRGPWDPEPSSSWLTIVGVASAVRDGAWSEPKGGQLYLLLSQNPSRIMHLVVRTAGDPTAIASAVRQSIESADPNQPVTEVRTMDDLIDASVVQRRLSMVLLAIFAAVATALAGLGIYGVMAYSVAQRTHEIGIRMALGAEPGDVLRLMVRDGMRLAGIGCGAGNCRVGCDRALLADGTVWGQSDRPDHASERGARVWRRWPWRRVIFRRDELRESIR